jgi:hypothetical protein
MMKEVDTDGGRGAAYHSIHCDAPSPPPPPLPGQSGEIEFREFLQVRHPAGGGGAPRDGSHGPQSLRAVRR